MMAVLYLFIFYLCVFFSNEGSFDSKVFVKKIHMLTEIEVTGELVVIV